MDAEQSAEQMRETAYKVGNYSILLRTLSDLLQK